MSTPGWRRRRVCLDGQSPRPTGVARECQLQDGAEGACAWTASPRDQREWPVNVNSRRRRRRVCLDGQSPRPTGVARECRIQDGAKRVCLDGESREARVPERQVLLNLRSRIQHLLRDVPDVRIIILRRHRMQHVAHARVGLDRRQQPDRRYADTRIGIFH